MTGMLRRMPAAAVRAWTRLYTWGLPPAVRGRRLAEIESDLWESEHDENSDPRDLPLQILLRLLAGMPDDVLWRLDQRWMAAGPARMRLAVALGVAGSLVLWLLIAASSPQLPALPEAPGLRPRDVPGPPPPPPPPPPCSPAGFPGPQTDCTR